MKRHIDTAAIKARYPLSSIVGQIVQLRRAGNEWEGLCPFHDDHDPSFYVNDDGGYYCHACGARGGDVIQFVMAYEKVGFAEACELISGGQPLGFHSPPALSLPSKGFDTNQWALEIWHGSGPVQGTPGEAYLNRRGIYLDQLPEPPPLGFAWRKHPKLPGERPALIAAFTDFTGAVVGIQQIFVTREGRKLEAEYPALSSKICIGKANGNTVKFGSGGNNILLAESIEDGLSLYQATPGSTVWAVAGAAKIPHIRLPDTCRTVTIAPDRDAKGNEAIEKGGRAFSAQGREVRCVQPPAPFKDWNEQLLAEKRA